MKIVDVHCHLDLYGGEYDKDPFNLDDFIKTQKENNVKMIITNGTQPDSNRLALKYAEKYDIVRPALGFYPTHVLEHSEEDFDKELEFMEKNKDKFIAFGETGLDNHHIKGKLEEQKKSLAKLVNLAKKIDKPIIIHSRDAELETVEFLEQFDYKKIVMHCFGGRKHLVKRIIKNGWYFSIPCNITKLQHFQTIVELCPFEKILTETDGPFLSPYSDIRRNEPRFIAESLKKIAEIKKITIEEASNIIFMNYQKLFL